jgi:hypothetical protein
MMGCEWQLHSATRIVVFWAFAQISALQRHSFAVVGTADASSTTREIILVVVQAQLCQ